MPKLAPALTDAAIKKKKAKSYIYRVADGAERGLALTVYPTGRKTFVLRWDRSKGHTLGEYSDKPGGMTLTQAREEARQVKADIAEYGAPRKRKDVAADTLKAFLDGDYLDWAKQNLSRGSEMCRRLKAVFDEVAHKPLEQISPFELERVRTKRLKAGRAVSTVNRETAQLRSALNRAVEWGLIDANPMRGVKQKKQDRNAKVRYLTKAEETRLMRYLNTRSDYIKPLVLLALNTGLRRGEIFNLRWRDVRLGQGAQLTVEGQGAKSGQTRYVPLNPAGRKAMKNWKAESDDAGPNAQVFPGVDGERLTDIKKPWATVLDKSKVKDFRFHDCRHHFASKLAMAGIDLNTIRELLGHSDLQMTMRYSHLSPDHKRAAVESI